MDKRILVFVLNCVIMNFVEAALKIKRLRLLVLAVAINLWILGACSSNAPAPTATLTPVPVVAEATPVESIQPTIENTSQPNQAETPAEEPTPTSDIQEDIILPEWPEGLPEISPLAAMMEGIQAGSADAPEGVQFVLDASLPDAPEMMALYVQSPVALTANNAKQMAKEWGLDASVYSLSGGVEEGASIEFTRKVFVAVDEPVRMTLEGAENVTYWDRSIFPDTGGRWSLPENLPPVDQAAQAAEKFLFDRPTLIHPYVLDTGAYENYGTIRFFQELDSGQVIWPSFAEATIGPANEVGRLVYRSYEPENLGEIGIVGAQQAWEYVSQGQPDGRLWFDLAARSWSAPALNPQAMNPRFWQREYPAGQEADLFGPLRILYPTAPGDAPHILMNNLVLEGAELAALAEEYRGLVESTGDVEAPFHVWGKVEDNGKYLACLVEGWESQLASSYYWSGLVRIDGQAGVLVTGDGMEIPLPNLPTGLVSETEVFVNGVQWEGQLEWTVIQESIAPAEPPTEQPAGVQAVIENVELIYLALPLNNIPLDNYADIHTRLIQPVWRFSGHTPTGAAFNIFVQAAADSYRQN